MECVFLYTKNGYSIHIFHKRGVGFWGAVFANEEGVLVFTTLIYGAESGDYLTVFFVPLEEWHNSSDD